VIPFLTALAVCCIGWMIFRLWHYFRTPWVPVLCYHHVAEPEGDDPGGLYVSPRLFNDQLGFLRKSGYSPVTLNQLYDHVAGGDDLPDNPVAVTFDDGYLDNWSYAFPMLVHFEVPATIFIITSKVGEGKPRPNLEDVRAETLTREALDREYRETGEDGSYLNWSELSMMQASGLVSLAGHSHTHVDLRGVDRRTALEDLRLSRGMLQEKGGGECLDLAWPFGFHSPSAQRTARVAGYRAAYRVSTRFFGGRGNCRGANPLTLRRLAVTPALDLEKALEFYHRPSLPGRLRAVLNFIHYHLGRSVQGRT
jgi:peptidoglycan/xylan/chitin deacetylase (PgdA/CDA1 family)